MVYMTDKALRDHKFDGLEQFECWRCGKVKPIFSDPAKIIFPMYGVNLSRSDADLTDLTCWQCWGELDKADMLKNGRMRLYLHEQFVTNWPGTLQFEVIDSSIGRHNMASTRTDVWFIVDGKEWHGAQYGKFSEICNCRRLLHARSWTARRFKVAN
jgi:hypothetical protein